MEETGWNVKGWLRQRAFNQVNKELDRQLDKWGEQNHTDGTGGLADRVEAAEAKVLNDWDAKHGFATWRGILHEEVYEAFAETDPRLIREELVQVAAVALSWIQAIDRRNPNIVPECRCPAYEVWREEDVKIPFSPGHLITCPYFQL